MIYTPSLLNGLLMELSWVEGNRSFWRGLNLDTGLLDQSWLWLDQGDLAGRKLQSFTDKWRKIPSLLNDWCVFQFHSFHSVMRLCGFVTTCVLDQSAHSQPSSPRLYYLSISKTSLGKVFAWLNVMVSSWSWQWQRQVKSQEDDCDCVLALWTNQIGNRIRRSSSTLL